MERYICIHGHFYQPPRENPWLESVELQHSAYPYHDWNERITEECYASNAASRILDAENRIIDIVNNYRSMSFNFGPTLLSWMQAYSPSIYQAVLEADAESQSRFSGHGTAISQAYNHMIMPLASRRDKYTQVKWGISDFEARFKRPPEGMWLPETAADSETLDVLAELGVRFTILAPHQAKRVRRLRARNWHDVSGGRIDPTRAYRVNLISGRSIAVFFYDGPVSRAVAFEGLLSSGEQFANRLYGAFSDARDWPQVVHIATDGESYGHHHPFGDMALAYAMNHIESGNQARLTNYGEFLEKYPPTHEAEIFENTSWSCVHGIERWRANCGCNNGGHAGWTQEWRAPLRKALDWLRDTVAPSWEREAGKLMKDPWLARDAYIKLILDRSPESRWKFFAEQATGVLSEDQVVAALKLLELQRHAMLMYTSCGWFFDDLSGIETVQVIQYAARVVQLAQDLFGDRIEEGFLARLETAKSNIPEHRDGRRVYEQFVKPAAIDLAKVAAHYVVSCLFEEYPKRTKIYCYAVDVESSQGIVCGDTRGLIGRATFTSEITLDSRTISFGVLQFSDHNIDAGVREFRGTGPYEEMLQEIATTCSAADFPGTVRVLDKHFGASTYSLRSLFRDEQNKVLDIILRSAVSEAESAYRQIYRSRYPLMRFVTDLGNPLPVALKAAAENILNADLRRALSLAAPDREAIGKTLEESKLWGVQLDSAGLGHIFKETLEAKMMALVASPEAPDLLGEMESLVDLSKILPFPVNMRQVQNSYHRLLKTAQPLWQDSALKDRFLALGEGLSIRVLPPAPS